jgi:hypothetical protein
MRYFYKAVVQAVLLYGSESWTVNEGIKSAEPDTGFVTEFLFSHEHCSRNSPQSFVKGNVEGIEWIGKLR